MDNVIDRFDGTEHEFLSNFSPDPITYLGLEWSTSEHPYQAMKSTDDKIREFIRQLKTPGQAKKAGRKIRPEFMRSDWDQIKVGVMYEILKAKFSNPELRAKLVSTHPKILIEGNTWGDTFWGVCKGVGQNWLGRLLMAIRQEELDGVFDSTTSYNPNGN